jgi:peptide/nickel transport system substrate-binding protein
VSDFESNRRDMLRLLARRCARAVVRGALALAWSAIATSAASAEPVHALAMHGAPALPADFTHMPYANPDAPKGGRLVQGLLGTFDSLNPLIVRGIAVQQVRGQEFERGYVYESLMTRGDDEAFTLYGLLARSAETCCFPGPCCATTAVPAIASIIPKSQRPRRSIRSRSGSISAASPTASCR